MAVFLFAMAAFLVWAGLQRNRSEEWPVGVGLVGALAMVGLGIWVLSIESSEDRRDREERERATCQEIVLELRQVLEREESIAAVEQRAAELGADVEVKEVVAFELGRRSPDDQTPLWPYEEGNGLVVTTEDGKEGVIATSTSGRVLSCT